MNDIIKWILSFLSAIGVSIVIMFILFLHEIHPKIFNILCVILALSFSTFMWHLLLFS